MTVVVVRGNALHLPLVDESIDAIVCDPPYGLEFMGKEWDKFARQDTTAGVQRSNAGGFGDDPGKPWNKARSGTKGVRSTFRCRRCGGWSGSFSDARRARQRPCACDTPDYDYAGAPATMLAFQSWCEQWTREALRVLRPGGHLLAFGGTRTSHRLACGIEDAGFEIRDAITWLYGQGFPKSLDVGKVIDKANGKHTRNLSVFGAYVRERREVKGWSLRQLDEAMGTNTAASWWEGRKSGVQPPSVETYGRLKAVLDMSDIFDDLIEWCEAEREKTGERNVPVGHAFAGDTYGGNSSCKSVDVTAPSTDDAKTWDGWGTALKPSSEPIIVARKPLGERTVAENVQTWGTGAINVDGCRVGTTDSLIGGCHTGSKRPGVGSTFSLPSGIGEYVQPVGRWPTNVVLTHTPDCDLVICAAGCPVARLDAQSGITTTPTTVTQGPDRNPSSFSNHSRKVPRVVECYGDTGGASRFFPTFRYQAKADSAQRVKEVKPVLRLRDDLTNEQREHVLAELGRLGVDVA